jgi:hypothetical protein
MKKNSFILIILFIIIGFVLGWFLKDFIFNDNEIVSNVTICNEKENDSYSFPYYDIYEEGKLFDIYSMINQEGSYLIFSYKDMMYMTNGILMNDVLNCTKDFTTDKSNGHELEYDGVYECTSSEEDYSNTTINLLDINPKEVYKVLVKEYPYSTDEQFSIFFINKDGTTDYYHYDGYSTRIYENILDLYRIKDVKIECIKYGDFECDKAQLLLTLDDDKTTTLRKFDFR